MAKSLLDFYDAGQPGGETQQRNRTSPTGQRSLLDAYQPLPPGRVTKAPPPQEPAPNQDAGLWSDTASLLKMGAGGIGRGVGYLTGIESLEQAGAGLAERAQQALSPAQQQAMQNEFVTHSDEEGYGFGPALTETPVRSLYGALVSSLPATAAGMGVGGLATKGLAAAGSAMAARGVAGGGLLAKPAVNAAGQAVMRPTAVSGAVGFGAGEGVVSAGIAGSDVKDFVRTADQELLDQAPGYQELIAQGLDPDTARETLAEELAGNAALGSGAIVGLLGAPMGAVFGRWMGGAGPQTMRGAVLGGAAGEAAQEAGQSAGEEYIGGTQRARIDPTEAPTLASMANQAVGGALAGGVMGGGFGAASGYAQQKRNALLEQAGIAARQAEQDRASLAERRAQATERVGGLGGLRERQGRAEAPAVSVTDPRRFTQPITPDAPLQPGDALMQGTDLFEVVNDADTAVTLRAESGEQFIVNKADLAAGYQRLDTDAWLEATNRTRGVRALPSPGTETTDAEFAPAREQRRLTGPQQDRPGVPVGEPTVPERKRQQAEKRPTEKLEQQAQRLLTVDREKGLTDSGRETLSAVASVLLERPDADPQVRALVEQYGQPATEPAAGSPPADRVPADSETAPQSDRPASLTRPDLSEPSPAGEPRRLPAQGGAASAESTPPTDRPSLVEAYQAETPPVETPAADQAAGAAELRPDTAVETPPSPAGTPQPVLGTPEPISPPAAPSSQPERDTIQSEPSEPDRPSQPPAGEDADSVAQDVHERPIYRGTRTGGRKMESARINAALTGKGLRKGEEFWTPDRNMASAYSGEGETDAQGEIQEAKLSPDAKVLTLVRLDGSVDPQGMAFYNRAAGMNFATEDDFFNRVMELGIEEIGDAVRAEGYDAVESMDLDGPELLVLNPAKVVRGQEPTEAQQAAPFTPTHEAPDGTPLRATAEPGVYEDAEGVEIEEANATPIAAAEPTAKRPALGPNAARTDVPAERAGEGRLLGTPTEDVLTSKGAPFKTQAAANFAARAKKLAGTHVPVERASGEWVLRAGEAPQAEAVPAAEAEQGAGQDRTPFQQAANRLAETIERTLSDDAPMKWMPFVKQANEAFGGTQSAGAYNIKDAYDAMELGLNRWVARTYKGSTQSTPQQIAKQIEQLEQKMALLPKQTKRTEEQIKLQQFSTPHTHSLVAAWVANITPNDVVLEPSAGTGNLVVHAQRWNPKAVHANELSDSRKALLDTLEGVTTHRENANTLNATLPKDVKPTVVVMNPPFSADINRPGKKDLLLGAKHVEQALKRLEPGGRLVAIVGRGMAYDRPRLADWWRKIEQEYTVRANIGISGKEYERFGTSFDNRILVIDKAGPTANRDAVVTGEVQRVADLLPMLETIRNDRVATREPAPAQPGREGSAAKAEGEAGPGVPVQPTADAGSVGTPAGRDDGQEPGRSDRDGGRPAGGRAEPGDAVSDRDAGGRPGADANEPLVSGDRPDRIGAVADLESTPPDRGDGLRISGTVRERKKRRELGNSTFEQYQPVTIVEGAKGHPTPLSESAAMSSVDFPQVDYTPKLPAKIINNGNLSAAQLETITYAGRAHQRMLADGRRQGFFVGDGTGVGKGAQVAGIILDNWNQGRKKAVWVSENGKLFEDAKRDADWVTLPENSLFAQSRIKGRIQNKEGVLFTTYDTLRSASKEERDAKGNIITASKRRLDQLIEWLGDDFDGVIAFDEAHNMGNALDDKGSRGIKKASAKALAGVELQKALPKARVLYVSATGATDVRNLAYADRLGLWGEGTPFPTQRDFIGNIEAGGLAAMEVVAKDMKSAGLYTARSLSYDGVTYGELLHTLNKDQTKTYNDLARSWQTVLQNVDRALEESGGEESGRAKAAARSAFWGAHQRFFNQIITAMQMPSVIEDVEKRLDNDQSVVLQLVNTNEAVQERRLAQAADQDIDLADLDITPRDILMQYLTRSFPTAQYEKYIDENGNEQSRPIKDSKGNPVENPDAVAMRDALIEKLGALPVPEGVLEQAINHFGSDKVAEITGRGRRLVRRGGEVVEEKLGAAKAKADADAFMSGKKRILIFSDAGGTGRSYHADLRAKNQQKRVHYLVQPGWRADKAVQGFGRTHRTNQAQPPEYILVTTNLKAQRRFLSSIARRLDQLGALTKGQRDTANQGLFSAELNLENIYATRALETLITDVARGRAEGITPDVLRDDMGLAAIDDDGNVVSDRIPTVPQFLNRLLSLTTDTMDTVFDGFFARLQANIDYARSQGTLDTGMETLTADRVEKTEDRVVHTDDNGTETRYVKLKLTDPTRFHKFDELPETQLFARNKRSGKLYAFTPAIAATEAKSGKIVERYRRIGVASADYVKREDVMPDKYERITGSNEQIRAQWDAGISEAPQTTSKDVDLIAGALLPIWDRLPGSYPKVVRALTDDGEQVLGRVLAPKEVSPTLRNLGADTGVPKMTAQEFADAVMNDGATLQLANGWEVKRRRVSGENRIEITGPRFNDMTVLKNQGAFTEVISYQTRVFVPADQASAVLGRIFESKPVVDVVQAGTNYSRGTQSRNTAAAVRTELGLNRRAERALLDSGLVNIVQSVSEVPGNHPSDAAAVYQDGTIWMVADNIPEGRGRGVLNHDLGIHHGLRKMVGPEQYAQIIESMKRQVKAGSQPNASQAARDTFRAHVLASRSTAASQAAWKQRYGQDMPKDRVEANLWEETIAYLAESGSNAPVLRRIMAAVRAFLRRLGLASDFTAADMAHLARGSIQRLVEGMEAQGQPATMYHRVFHGTPHLWQPEPGFPHGRPRLDKIGTGEGAQAYGHGVYLAEAEAVARGYRNELSEHIVRLNGKTVDLESDELSSDEAVVSTMFEYLESGDSVDEALSRAISDLQDSIEYHNENIARLSKLSEKEAGGRLDRAKRARAEVEQALDAAKRFDTSGLEIERAGQLYHLDIPDNVIPTLLDWDAKLSEQPQAVQDAILDTDAFGNNVLGQWLVDEQDGKFVVLHGEFGRPPKKTGRTHATEDAAIKAMEAEQRDMLRFMTGEELYRNMVQATMETNRNLSGPEAAKRVSETLRDAGIPGNRYLDAGSRGTGDGTRNVVLWDQSVLDRVALLKRNEEALDAIQAAQDTQYSRDASQRDAEYLAAVERGDMDTAQRLVDEAAKDAGLIPVWHGFRSGRKGNRFDPDKILSGEGSAWFGDDAFSFAVTESGARAYAKQQGTVERFYIPEPTRVGLSSTFDNILETQPGDGVVAGYEHDVDRFGPVSASDRATIKKGGLTRDLAEKYAGEPSEYSIPADLSGTIKSAEAVTRDNAGNVIPLSQRFNPRSDDVRYSRRPADTTPRAALGRSLLARNRGDVAAAQREAKALYPGLSEDINDWIEQNRDRWQESGDDVGTMYSRANAQDDARAVLQELDARYGQRPTLKDRAGNIGEWFGSLTRSNRRLWLNLLTRQQIVDVGKDVQPLASEFEQLARQMDADANKLITEHSKTIEGWVKRVSRLAGRANNDQAALLARTMHEATIAGFDPSVNKPTTPEERQVAKMWAALDANSRKLFQDVRDAYSARREELERALVMRLAMLDPRTAPKTKDALYRKAIDTLMDREAAGESPTRRQSLTALRMQMENNRVKGPYFPLSRFGDYYVVATKAGEEKQVMRFERGVEWRRAQGELEAEGWTIKAGKDVKNLMTDLGPSANFMKDIFGVLESSDAGLDQTALDAIKDDMWQMYLMTLPDQSIRKHFIHRQNRRGFSQDALRAFAHHMHHSGRQIARMRYSSLMADTLTGMKANIEGNADPEKASDILDGLGKSFAWMMNPTTATWATRATSFGFGWYLGVSPAAAMINMSQVPIVSLPILGAQYGPVKATKALSVAMKDYSKAAFSNEAWEKLLATPGVGRMLQEIEDSGAVDRTLASSVLGLDEENVDIRLTEQKIMEKVGFLFHKAERWNREVTAIAAYRLAREANKSHEQGVLEAYNAIFETQFDYSCVDAETEILTDGGWKRYTDLREGESIPSVDNDGRLVHDFVEAINIHEGDIEVIHFTGANRFNMMLTPNHRCVTEIYDSKQKKWYPSKLVRADEISDHHFIPRTPRGGLPVIGNSDPRYGEPFASLLGWVAAEGQYNKFSATKTDRRSVRIAQSAWHNPHYVDEIDEILEQFCPNRYSRNETRGGEIIVWSLQAEIGDRFLDLMPDKKLTFELFETMNEAEMRAVLDAFSKGDGHWKDGAWTICQNGANIQNLNVLQAMATAVGITSTLSPPDKYDRATLRLCGGIRRSSQRSMMKFMKADRHTVPLVWCPTTGTGRWIARRNGAVFVTGNSGNRAHFMRGNTARVLLLFRQYSQNMTYLLWRNFQQSFKGESPEVRRVARNKLMGVLGTTGVFAGAMGMPLVGVMLWVSQMAHDLLDDDDEEWDAELALRQTMNEWLGPVADVAARGVFGAGIGTRTSLDELWIRSPYGNLEGRDLAYHYLEQAAGPVVGIGVSAFRGIELMSRGNIQQGFETALPKVIKDVLRAERYYDEGVQSLRGDQVVGKDELDWFDLAMQASGVAPHIVTERYEQNRNLRNLQDRIIGRRRALINRYYMAWRDGDTETVRDTVRDMRAFSMANPRAAISADTIRQSIRARARTTQKRTLSGSVFDQNLLPYLREQQYLN